MRKYAMRVLITGGTGTIGKQLIKKFHKKWDIAVFSRDELKQSQLRAQYPNLRFHIGDVRDYHAVFKATRDVDAVIHTAAMKRIEVCEVHPLEATKTNVLGTENVVMAARERGVKRLISISSDKGVEPINVYGMTKAMQEKIVLAAGYNCARYGNVFGSRGSVIPLFIEQAKAGGPLTVTDPDMTRFILNTEQAIDLIMMAFTRPMAGRVFVRKSPSARVGDIAEAFGTKIKIIGKMTGEKLHEMLLSAEETTRVDDLGEYFVINQQTKTSKYGKPYTSDIERLLTKKEIKNLIDKWIPA